jgi:hypothetical protein
MRSLLAFYLAAPLMTGIVPSPAGAEEFTWERVNTELDITVGALARVRVFAKGCGSVSAELLALDFVDRFSSRAPVKRIDVETLVESKFQTQLRLSAGSRSCQPDFLKSATEFYQTYDAMLTETLSGYLKQPR